jgi:3-hydroxyacyl-[acyl-carrier-protein] dehydratase
MTLDRAAILDLLPHRPPFLFVDEITEIVPGESAVGLLHVSKDAFWVPGHFPQEAIMPGVLIAEALAQTAALMFLAQHIEHAGAAVYLIGFDKLRFRVPVRPGDTLELRTVAVSLRRRMATFQAEAFVDGKRVANGTLMAMVG